MTLEELLERIDAHLDFHPAYLWEDQEEVEQRGRLLEALYAIEKIYQHAYCRRSDVPWSDELLTFPARHTLRHTGRHLGALRYVVMDLLRCERLFTQVPSDRPRELLLLALTGALDQFVLPPAGFADEDDLLARWHAAKQGFHDEVVRPLAEVEL